MQTQNDHLQSIFVQHPNEWLSMIDLGHQIGAWAVHSRVADLRNKRCMTIECHKEKDPITRKVLSSYRWVPKTSASSVLSVP